MLDDDVDTPVFPFAPVETDPVEMWRLEELLRAGYPVKLAMELAPRVDIGLHHAVELAGGGCPHELAARILL